MRERLHLLAHKYFIHPLQKDYGRIGTFVSIPKNASKSIIKILKLGPNRDFDETKSLVVHENHQRGEILARRYDLGKMFVFCFVRNPYERCVSWYHFHHDIAPYNQYSFREWIKAGMPHHWTVQNLTDYRRIGLSPLLQYNYTKNTKVDFVGRMENFGSDMETIVRKLNQICRSSGIPHEFSYKPVKRNTSKHREAIDYFDEETIGIANKLLKDDFRNFGYEMKKHNELSKKKPPFY